MNLRLMSWQKKTFLLIFLFTVGVRLFTLDAYPLLDKTESRYAEISRKMVETGNWVTPQISYGVPFWGKPPLSFWLTAASLSAFGVNDVAARLPSFLLAILIAWLIYNLALRQRSWNCAISGVFVLSSTALFFFMSGQVMTDQALVLGTTLSMTAFWRALADTESMRRLWGYLFFIGLAIGVLAKGLLAIVLTAIPLGIWVIGYKKWRALFRDLPWVTGTTLMLAIAVPWYLWAEMRTPGFLHYFFVGEHWDRYTQSGWKGDLYGFTHVYRRGTIWVYWIAAAFPWSLVFIALLIKMGRPVKPSISTVLNDQWLAYLSLWAAAPLILFSFTTSILVTYVLPSLPASALLTAEILQRYAPRENRVNTVLNSSWLTFMALPVPVIALLLVIFVAPGVAPFKSQKDLVARYMMLRSDPSSPLIYLFDKPHSAEFYSQGKARETFDANKAAEYLSGARDGFVVAKEGELALIPDSVLTQLEPVGKFGNCVLLRKRSR